MPEIFTTWIDSQDGSRVVKKAEENLECQTVSESETIINTYQKMDGEQKELVKRSAQRIVEVVKSKAPFTQFDFYDALELLAKTGWFIASHDKRRELVL